jgi:outer membrane protein OmpA-like peptidoglycan-associated protein
VTRADYDAVLAQLDSLKNRKPETVEVVKTVTETKEVVVRETHFVPRNTVITFTIGSATLSKVEKAKVELFAAGLAQDANVYIVGSADTQTGSEKRNNTLAELRANAVKDVLVNEYGVAADRIVVDTRLDATDNVETSRSAILTLTAE